MADDELAESSKQKVCVIGAGSFGTVIASLLANNGHEVSVWLRDAEHLNQLRSDGCNRRYLPDFELPQSIQFTDSLVDALADVSVVFLSVPSKAFRPILGEIKKYLPAEAGLVTTAKGIEAQGFNLMSGIVKEILPNNAVAALSGPNLAKEIAAGELTGSVIASSNKSFNQNVQKLLSSRTFRVYDNEDIFGVELAGALKNIYAIASGMAHALGMGENARSMLLTRSLAEMSRFAVYMGANPMTFLGLSGVGDLFVTCSSPLSRNFRLGFEIAKGASVEDALTNIAQTVEGMSTVKTVVDYAEEQDIYMPLAKGLYQVLYEGQSILDVVKVLMLGDNNHDVEFSKDR